MYWAASGRKFRHFSPCPCLAGLVHLQFHEKETTRVPKEGDTCWRFNPKSSMNELGHFYTDTYDTLCNRRNKKKIIHTTFDRFLIVWWSCQKFLIVKQKIVCNTNSTFTKQRGLTQKSLMHPTTISISSTMISWNFITFFSNICETLNCFNIWPRLNLDFEIYHCWDSHQVLRAQDSQCLKNLQIMSHLVWIIKMRSAVS